MSAGHATLDRLRALVEGNQSFLLTGHVNVDGDSLGSMLGLYHVLRRRGKQVTALVHEPIAERYAFLPGAEAVEVFDAERHGALAKSVDVFMMFDFSSPKRAPGLWDLVKAGRAFKVCIDHHPTDVLPGDLNFHDPASPATGKVVLDLVRALGEPLDRTLAEPLFVAIATDTGWFRYSNTSGTVLADAAALVATGLDAHRIHREVYQRNDLGLVRLIGRVAASLQDEEGGRLLWASIPNRLIEELGVGNFETDQLLDLMRTARDVELVLLLRETPGGEVRVNLRSRGTIDLTPVATRIGGGGHRHAAGATLKGSSLEAARDRVLPILREALAASPRLERGPRVGAS